jgi:hypothetical protein
VFKIKDLKQLVPDGPIYRAQKPNFEGASARYRGQIGRSAAIPHSRTANISFRKGDVPVTGDGMDFLTYYSRDLESLTLPA